VIRGLLISLLLAGMIGCSTGEQLAAAERGVASFRRLVELGQFAEVYSNGSEELRRAGSEVDMAKVLAGLSAKLGKVKSSEKNGTNINFHTSGTFVTLGFKTEFEKGAGAEQFVFRVIDGKALLISYNVNSLALLTN